jgi:hypothetical protein
MRNDRRILPPGGRFVLVSKPTHSFCPHLGETRKGFAKFIKTLFLSAVQETPK